MGLRETLRAWTTRFLHDREPGDVTSVKPAPRPAPVDLDAMARVLKGEQHIFGHPPRPRHADPGDTFEPRPAAREHNPRLQAPLRQVSIDLPPRHFTWQVRQTHADGTVTEWRDVAPGRVFLPMVTEGFELRRKPG